MLLLQVLLTAAALLLVVAGVTKARSPHAATRAARAMSLPASPRSIRLLAVCEVGVGVAVILTDATAARVALAVLYAAFFTFVLIAIGRRAPISSCGCFGADDAPPSLAHAAINATGAAVAAVAAFDAVVAPLAYATESASKGIALVVGATLVVLAAGAVLTGRLLREPRRPRRGPSRSDAPADSPRHSA